MNAKHVYGYSGALMVLALILTMTGVLEARAVAAESAARAGLSANQIERLRALDMPVAVPADVPEQFEVIAVEAVAGDASGWPPPHYRIRYGSDGGLCFRIESTSGGVGGPVPASRWAVYPFAFLPSAESPWFVYFTRHTARQPFFPYLVFSDWMQKGRWLYRLTSGYARMDNCGSIGPRLAARVVESLAFLDTAPALRADAFDTMPRYQAFSFQSSAGASPTQAAIEALVSLDLTFAQADRSVQILAQSDTAARLLITYDHLRDDSVAAQRYRLTLVYQEPHWRVQDIAVQQRCHRAPARDWSAKRCP